MTDPMFRVEVITQTPNPQQCVYGAMHQDYSEGFVYDSRDAWPDEKRAGEIAVKQLLAGGRGHFGPLEHPSIVFNCGWFPHSVMQQARTHRVGVSFDVQSGRYTSARFVECAEGGRDVEEVFYLRPVGKYNDRQGKKYEYTAEQRLADLERCLDAAKHYALRLSEGMAEEQARGLIPFDFRQHFVMSFNLRSVLHFMDLRSKLDAQDEIRALCDHMWPHVKAWVPEISAWYEVNRLGKARLAP